MKTIGREIDFVGNCMAESTEYFFLLLYSISIFFQRPISNLTHAIKYEVQARRESFHVLKKR